MPNKKNFSSGVDALWNFLMSRWWGHWAFAGLLLLGGFLYLLVIFLLERWGMQTNSVVYLLQRYLGKTGGFLFFAIPACIFLVTGVMKLLSKPRQ